MYEEHVSSEIQLGELLSKAWDVFLKNAAVLLSAILLTLVIAVVGSWFSMGLAGLVLSGPLAYGLSLICLKLVRGESVEFNLLFSGFQKFLPSFMAWLLISLFATIGLLLCIIPGLYVSIIFMLTYFYMVDQNLDFWPAMEASRKTISKDLGKWVVIWLVIVVLNLIGALLCGLGQLVTAPVSLLMLAEAYNRLNPQEAATLESVQE